jgi:chromosome segregation ATPase
MKLYNKEAQKRLDDLETEGKGLKLRFETAVHERDEAQKRIDAIAERRHQIQREINDLMKAELQKEIERLG